MASHHHRGGKKSLHKKKGVSSSFAEEWKRVILDPESPALVAAMVHAARARLRQDINYQSYRIALAEQQFKPTNFFLAAKRKADSASLINDWIDELLRFLAMKVLIVGEPTPSKCVRDAWRALMLLPITYGRVCRAMGSPTAVEFYIFRAAGTANDNDGPMSLQDYWYGFTLESYEMLFKEEAPVEFWPVERGGKKDDGQVLDFAPKAESLSPFIEERRRFAAKRALGGTGASTYGGAADKNNGSNLTKEIFAAFDLVCAPVVERVESVQIGLCRDRSRRY